LGWDRHQQLGFREHGNYQEQHRIVSIHGERGTARNTSLKARALHDCSSRQHHSRQHNSKTDWHLTTNLSNVTDFLTITIALVTHYLVPELITVHVP